MHMAVLADIQEINATNINKYTSYWNHVHHKLQLSPNWQKVDNSICHHRFIFVNLSFILKSKYIFIMLKSSKGRESAGNDWCLHSSLFDLLTHPEHRWWNRLSSLQNFMQEGNSVLSAYDWIEWYRAGLNKCIHSR